MQKILVTGGTGFIGSHTTVELIQAGYTVTIVDNLFNSKITVLDKIEQITGVRPRFYEVDLLDYDKLEQVFRTDNFDAVIHFAGLKAIAESVEKPILYYETNLGSTLNLLKLMQKYGVNNLIFSSSATVYGTQDETVLDETMPTGKGITNPYGRTKYMIEEILKDVAVADRNFSPVILRYFNPVGMHASGLLGEDPNNRPNNLMPIVMKVATGEIPELSVYGNDYPTPDGTCIRDYIHVVDLAAGHVCALEHMKEGVQIYNLGTGRGYSVLDVVKAYGKVCGKEIPYEIKPRRPGDIATCYSDPSKAEKELGWKAKYGIEEMCADSYHWQSENPEGYQA